MSINRLQLVEKMTTYLGHLPEIQRFHKAEEQINRSVTVQRYIERIKKKQKELVHAKHYKKSQIIRTLEFELEALQNEFDSLPIVVEYQQSQVSVNDILQVIQKIFFNTISKKINVKMGEMPKSGCSSGGSCKCS